MSNKKLVIGCSPLSGKIFAGSLLKDGKTWSANKQDVTDTAVGAVAEHLMKLQEVFEFEIKGKTYRMGVVEVGDAVE